MKYYHDYAYFLCKIIIILIDLRTLVIAYLRYNHKNGTLNDQSTIFIISI